MAEICAVRLSTGDRKTSANLMCRSVSPLPASLEYLSVAALRIILLLSAARLLQPLWSPQDEMTDIPLTPTQRKLLGLTPSSAPPTPTTGAGGAYITPPRYARSSTPRSDSSRAAVAGSSPVGPGTPFGGGSPLARKAMEGRRSSYGNMSPSLFDEGGSSSRGSPGDTIGSPIGRGASVGLNSKWLYQRGKGRLSGSVF